jgi:hypothetical protein
MSNPDVSVILPVYNDADTVGNALESVLYQTFDDYEVVVVDDGSTDDSAAVVRDRIQSSDPVRLVEHERNRGLPAALNTGLEAIEGQFAARQDADDKSLPERLSTQFEYLSARPNVGVLATGVEVVDANGHVTGSFAPPTDPTTVLDRGNPIVHGSIMARRDALLSVGGYDEFFKYCQDYDLWNRLARAEYELRAIPDRLYRLQREQGSLTIAQRQTYATYAAMARAPPAETERLKKIADEEGINALIPHLDPRERAKIHRRLVQANVEYGQRLGALRAALQAVVENPLGIRSYAHLALALAPLRLSKTIVKQVQGR